MRTSTHSTVAVVIVLTALSTGCAATVVAPHTSSESGQRADALFVLPDTGRARTAPGEGPYVAVDAAQRNYHTADGRYAAFAALLRHDGYRVGGFEQAFSGRALEGVDVLVISNALSAANDADGSGRMTFQRDDGTLADHAVTRSATGEAIARVTTFTGQAFRFAAAVDADPLMRLSAGAYVLLPSEAWEFSDATPRISAEGMSQGALVRHGLGRVAVFGEAAMFSAQVQGEERTPMGMNHPEAPHNARFLLNVMRWLSESS